MGQRRRARFRSVEAGRASRDRPGLVQLGQALRHSVVGNVATPNSSAPTASRLLSRKLLRRCFRRRALEVAAFGRWRGQVVIGDWALGCSGGRPHLRLRLSFPHARSFRHQSHSTPELGRISPWSAETGGSTKDAFYSLPYRVGVLVLLV
ncbi:Uncharacterised protein [Mycobacteroides abscessus subsp. abscessus]|nr:Uncharacterised protein [Mycobacteroides abscessus subsp. abscessus]